MTRLEYTIKVKELKGMGYSYYNKNYKLYALEIKKYAYTIWIFVSGKMIQVNDWYDNTYAVVEFYKANRDDINFLDKDYIMIALNRETSKIIICTRYEELDNMMKTLDASQIPIIKEKYKDTNEICLYKNEMDKVVIELEKLKPITINY